MHDENGADSSVSITSVSLDLGRDERWSPDTTELVGLMSNGAWRIKDDPPAESPHGVAGSESDGRPQAGVDVDPPDAVQPDKDRLVQSIVEQARAQAHYEAERIRHQALKEVQEARAAQQEELRAEAQREAAWLRESAVAEAEQVKASIVEQARAQAQYEAAQLRQQAAAEAEERRRLAAGELDAFKASQLERVRADVQAEESRLRQEAEARTREEALSLRDDALAEAEQVKAAIIEHARAKAAAQSSRMLQEVEAQAHRLLTEATQAAEREAERIRREAADEAEKVRAEALETLERLELKVDEDELCEARMDLDDTDQASLLTSSEIGNREFPIAMRGFDRESVRKWLRLVEVSHGILEEELDRARAEWERALEILGATRVYVGRLPKHDVRAVELPLDRELDRARAEWERSIETLMASRPKRSDSSFRSLLLQKAQIEDLVGHQLFGYSKAQVRELLDSSASQVARLENQVANLRAENDELRSRMLHQVLEATPQFITLPGQQDPAIAMRGLLGPPTLDDDGRLTGPQTRGLTESERASNGHSHHNASTGGPHWTRFSMPNGALGGPDAPDAKE